MVVPEPVQGLGHIIAAQIPLHVMEQRDHYIVAVRSWVTLMFWVVGECLREQLSLQVEVLQPMLQLLQSERLM